MKIQYLPTVEAGARWFRSYYRRNPQLDFRKATAALRAAEQTLSEFPFAGERFEEREDVREQHIMGTHFALLYTVARGSIWIIDLRDTRGLRSAEALSLFARELRARLKVEDK